ncbi:MAG: response regulator transcription factor [Ruminococcus sp.]|nr:response regulator transcription factor [Ruminococcus sp.]
MKGKVLIAEDDREISRILSDVLTGHGYEVRQACDGQQAAELFEEDEPDLVLMDLMMPKKSGEQLIRELREKSEVPVIVISARSMMETKLEVLRLGADDYLIKPFDINEVLVRAEVVLRRTGRNSPGTIKRGGLVFYTEENRASFGEVSLNLTAKELMMLRLLMEHPKKVYTKAELYETVWNEPYYYEDNTINVHVSNLRSKLKKVSGTDPIETVWGVGYRFREGQ